MIRLSLHALLLAALLLRGLLPLGYMPGNMDGEAGLVFCTSQGASLSLVEAAKLSGVHADQHCPYAAALDLAAVLPVAGSQSFAVLADTDLRRHVTEMDVFTSSPPQARGPPVERI